jgi:hypothetical protein
LSTGSDRNQDSELWNENDKPKNRAWATYASPLHGVLEDGINFAEDRAFAVWRKSCAAQDPNASYCFYEFTSPPNQALIGVFSSNGDVPIPAYSENAVTQKPQPASPK